MGIPWIQKWRVGSYLVRQRLAGVRRYPLVLMLEPLLQCNLSCPGCGKVDQPAEVLGRRLSRAECVAAAEECGAPVVSIAGGEPLLHDEMAEIVGDLVGRRRFVYLCTNAVLLERKLGQYRPSPYLTFSVHLDGSRERHDAAVGRPGTFDRAVAAIGRALAEGFRVTVNCTVFQNQDAAEVAAFFTQVTRLGVEGITVAPGFSYEQASDRGAFLGADDSRQLFRRILGSARGKGWRFNHSALFLDFLAGNRNYRCTPWGNPTRSVRGWQRPCYLLGDEHVPTFRELIDDTDWERYGSGRDPRCADCRTHCGYEPTAVEDAVAHPWRALAVALRGPGRRR